MVEAADQVRTARRIRAADRRLDSDTLAIAEWVIAVAALASAIAVTVTGFVVQAAGDVFEMALASCQVSGCGVWAYVVPAKIIAALGVALVVGRFSSRSHGATRAAGAAHYVLALLGAAIGWAVPEWLLEILAWVAIEVLIEMLVEAIASAA
jgi:hypothetical protein